MPSNGQKRNSLTNLAKSLGSLSPEHKKIALEMSASLAGVSLRVGKDFVEAVPRAATVLSPEHLRLWAEYGRKLAMGNVELGSEFFYKDLSGLRLIPEDARGDVFIICTRQLNLSSKISLATFDLLRQIGKEITNERFLGRALEIAAKVSERSAKHSGDLLKNANELSSSLAGFASYPEVSEAILDFTDSFAFRTGGMTADLWIQLPKILPNLDAENITKLLERARDFLEYGGSVTMHVLQSGASVIKQAPRLFDEWLILAKQIAPHGGTLLINFLKSSPGLFATAAKTTETEESVAVLRRVLELIAAIAREDAESAIAACRSASRTIAKVSLKQFEEWVETGLKEFTESPSKVRRSYFALETRQSNESLYESSSGLRLEKVQRVLRTYIEGLTGKDIEINPTSSVPQESRIGDGLRIYLPEVVDEFGSDEMDFRLYKVLAAHGAGQIEFGTFSTDLESLKAAYTSLSKLYEATAEQTDAFSLSGYIEDVQGGERALTPEEQEREDKETEQILPANSDYRAVLDVFPDPRLAKRIFTTMENARIDSALRREYRGLVKDLDLMRELLKKRRPFIFDVPINQVPSELLFQITLCGGATDDARSFYGQIVSEIETVVESYLSMGVSDVGDSLMATSRVYSLFMNISPEDLQAEQAEQEEQSGEFAYDLDTAAEGALEEKAKVEGSKRETSDVKELFNAWNMDEDQESEEQDVRGSQVWVGEDIPEEPLEVGDLAFSYDEWDRELNDYRVGWSRVIEKKVRQGDRNFVELTRSRYRGVISSIRHQFQLMKPENLTKVNRELDGEDYDLDAVIDFVIDRRADGRQSENLYTKKLRRERDVAVTLLLDQSSSTARTITRNPLQPYTYPGKRIIEIEKEGLILMSEALDAVGDRYSIAGFTSEGRRNVKYYVIKDFKEKYSEEIEKRIGGITFQSNTRLGAAIRHASRRLVKEDSKTRLLIILTDGRPYDHDYGDMRYAREDVREALSEARASGVTPFCVTIDKESETELKDLYGAVGYTIIDNVLSLPERMPGIYRRLTR
jgi:nitric oxide reductase NorD protein